MSSFNLQQHEIAVEKIYRNLASSALAKEKTECDPVFGLDVVTKCPNVPSEILIPRNVWSDKAAYEAAAKK